MSALTPLQRRTAAQLLSSFWTDGKRRVVVTKREVFRHRGQTLVMDPGKVIEDPQLIGLLEEHEIELLDLAVNGKPKRGAWVAGDTDYAKNVDAIAHALGIVPNLLHEAIESGKEPAIQAVANAIAKTFVDTLERVELGPHDGAVAPTAQAEPGDWEPGKGE